MTIEGPTRQLWPHWRIMSFMATLSLFCGLSSELYVTQLLTCAAMGAREGERDNGKV